MRRWWVEKKHDFSCCWKLAVLFAVWSVCGNLFREGGRENQRRISALVCAIQAILPGMQHNLSQLHFFSFFLKILGHFRSSMRRPYIHATWGWFCSEQSLRSKKKKKIFLMSRQRKGLLSSGGRSHVAFVDSLSTVSLSWSLITTSSLSLVLLVGVRCSCSRCHLSKKCWFEALTSVTSTASLITSIQPSNVAWNKRHSAYYSYQLRTCAPMLPHLVHRDLKQKHSAYYSYRLRTCAPILPHLVHRDLKQRHDT